MARYWSGTIDSIPLEEAPTVVAGFELTGAAAFLAEITGNTVPSLKGKPQTQYSAITMGQVLELKFLHIPQSLATALLASLAGTLGAGSSKPCTFTDGYQTISAMFKPHVPAWYERGNPDGDFINDFVLRIIKTGEIEP